MVSSWRWLECHHHDTGIVEFRVGECWSMMERFQVAIVLEKNVNYRWVVWYSVLACVNLVPRSSKSSGKIRLIPRHFYSACPIGWHLPPRAKSWNLESQHYGNAAVPPLSQMQTKGCLVAKTIDSDLLATANRTSINIIDPVSAPVCESLPSSTVIQYSQILPVDVSDIERAYEIQSRAP